MIIEIISVIVILLEIWILADTIVDIHFTPNKLWREI